MLYDVMDAFDQFDKVFGFGDVLSRDEVKPAVKYSVPNFPPAKITQNTKDGSLTLLFHLAGYSKEDLTITYDKDYLVLTGKVNKETKDDEKVIANTLKCGNFSYKYLVPTSKFDKKTTKADFVDGVLKINVAVNKETEQDMKPITIN